ncbi:toll/interleukin-1 receptor domain-containing protein [Pontixanthobacter gangjinensis]|uniref:TIR domain-containing protein n=1 Tax=Pontixanthobacter gangjinensis TaxID=1028742 RepID=A0A6I4SNH1_9SPHN|nr:toll/interleukin-1 receptor domain-containing protein [Pontixanthobacter gangjinensis]MXO56690.1 TIR domain-containing protein [Pontixanthobacter gangjinensis]
MSNYTYQIAILGAANDNRDRIRTGLLARMAEIGIEKTSVSILEDEECLRIDPKAATAAVFLGYEGAINDTFPALERLLADTIPIIPIVEDLNLYKMSVPPGLRAINGKKCRTETEVAETVSLVLENLNLLRKDRRLFVSYKRDDSTGVAEQLSDVFTEHGFDVFLDTRSVRPSDSFQDELWHRMADSDVVILLDTPNFRESEWTVAELTQANSTSVQILHLLWPGIAPEPNSAFSVYSRLQNRDFAYIEKAPDRLSRLQPATVDKIILQLESLRARAIAARHTDLFDSVSDAALEVGAQATLHPQRYMTLRRGGRDVAILPTVGVPSSPRLHGFLDVIRDEHAGFELTAIYDERGVLDSWRSHLSWLAEHLPVKTVENGQFLNWLSEGSAE